MNKRVESKNKKIKITIAIIIILFIVIFIIVLIAPKNTSDNRSDYWYIFSRSIPFVGTSFLLFIIEIIDLYLDVNMAKFNSIKEESFYYKDKFPEDAHSVLSVLNQTQTDCFVIAYFKKENEIRPAVYTIHKKRISYLDSKVEKTYLKKIYLNDNNFEKYIRVYRIKNSSTNSQMLFFASDIKPLDIRINNQSVVKYKFGNRLGNFDVYGIKELPDITKYNYVKINGRDYPLKETRVYNCFINANEIHRTERTGDG